MSTALEEKEKNMKRVQWRTHADLMQLCEDLAIALMCCGLRDSVRYCQRGQTRKLSYARRFWPVPALSDRL